MTKNKLREIKIGSDTYLWKRTHLHLTGDNHIKCIEKVVIYLKGHKKSSLQLLFREEDKITMQTDIEIEKWCIGYPDEGVIGLYKLPPTLSNQKPYPIDQPTTIHINLNRPAVIADLIKYFLQDNWKPKESTKPLMIEDALKLLKTIALPKGIN